MAQVFVTMKYTLLDYLRARRFAILAHHHPHHQRPPDVPRGALQTARPCSTHTARLLLIVVGQLLVIPRRALRRLHGRRRHRRGVPEQDRILHHPQPGAEVVDLRREIPRSLHSLDRSSCWSISAIAIANGIYYFGASVPLPARRVFPLRMVLPSGGARIHLHVELPLQDELLLHTRLGRPPHHRVLDNPGSGRGAR